MNWRDHLPIHPAAELFPLMSAADIKELAADIKANGLRNDIIIWSTPDDDDKREMLIDGRNRLDALALLGLLCVDDEGFLATSKRSTTQGWIDEGAPNRLRLLYYIKGEDPYALALSFNIHRRHLTPEQKRELIAKLIKQTPNKSDRQIAKQTKTSPTTVGNIRKKSEAAGDVSKLDTRTDTKGRKQPSAKPQKSAKPVAPPKTDPIGSPPVRYSEAPATSAPRLSETAHFLINEVSSRLKEVRPKLSTCDYAAVCTTIRALVDGDDIVSEALRLVEKMTPAQRRDFAARLRTEGLIGTFVPQGSAEVSTEQRRAEHAALDGAAS